MVVVQMEERWTGQNKCVMTSWAYRMSLAWQLIQYRGSVPKALQLPGAPVPCCPFKNIPPSPSPPVMEWVMYWRRNDHSEQHQAAAIRMAQFCYETGTDTCRQLDCRLTSKRTFQGAAKCCICKDGGESRSLLCQKGIFCARLSIAPRASILLLGVGRKLSG